jgi:DNA polymerase II small subunit/DNA polymerase delta subunit B
MVIPTIYIENHSQSYVETKVVTEANGSNATVKTEINNTVNGQNYRYESDKPGTVTVTIGTKSPEITPEVKIMPPTVIPSGPSPEPTYIPTEQSKSNNIFSGFWNWIVSLFRKGIDKAK